MRTPSGPSGSTCSRTAAIPRERRPPDWRLRVASGGAHRNRIPALSFMREPTWSVLGGYLNAEAVGRRGVLGRRRVEETTCGVGIIWTGERW